MRQPRADTSFEKQCSYAMGAMAIVAPQLLGGATPETQLAILTLGALVSAAVAFTSSEASSSRSLPLAGIGAAIAVAWTGAQLLPLPCGLFDSSFADRMSILHALEQLGAVDHVRCTITAAPGSTRNALAMSAVLCALLLAATHASQRHVRLLRTSIAVSSVTMAFVALLHAVFDADAVFGIYTPRVRPGLLLAPLLNGNHLAGHLALGFPLCLSFALSARRADLTVSWLVGAGLIAASTFMTLSRGGVGALALGGGGYLLAHHFLAPRKRSEGRSPLATIGATLLLICLATWSAFGAIFNQFRQEGAALDKLEMAVRLLPLVRSHPVAGIGRGALVDATPSIMDGATWTVYAENLPIHWAIEWGVPVSAVILTTLFISFSRSLRTRPSTMATLFGLVSLAAQNLVDFSLELAGIASVAAIALGTVLYRERPSPIERRLPTLRMWLTAMSVVAVVAVGAAVPTTTYAARVSLRRGLADALEAGDKLQLDRLLALAFRYYPVDPAIIVLAAANAVRHDERVAPKWLNLSLRVAERWAGPHLHAAYFLENQGRLDQAAAELGLAGELDFGAWRDPVCQFLARHTRAELAMAAASQGSIRQRTLEHMLSCLPRTSAAAAELASNVLQEFPTSLEALVTNATSAASAGDLTTAKTLTERALSSHPDASLSWRTMLSVWSAMGADEEAFARLRNAPQKPLEDQFLLVTAAETAAARRDISRLGHFSSLLISLHGRSADRRADLHAHVSRLYSIAGAPLEALVHAQRAYQDNPTPERAELTLHAAEQAGVTEVALRMAAELCQVGHRERRYCAGTR